MARFRFGVFPGVADTDHEGAFVGALPEAVGPTLAALERLAGDAPGFYVRGYRPFHGPAYRGIARITPDDLGAYVGGNRIPDVVLQYQSQEGDVAGFAAFCRAAVREHGARPGKFQIVEEPNVGLPLDGGYPGVYDALAAGVLAAKDEARRIGADEVAIGFNAAVVLGSDDPFWAALAARAGTGFLEAVDFVGFDCFPDVFRPLSLDRLPDAVTAILTGFRAGLTRLGLPAAVPIHVTENGWPTGPEHPEDRQAEVLEAVIRTVHAARESLGIEAYELFALRDWNTGTPNRYVRFGVLRDDYTPKPAFAAYQRLVAELSSPARP